MTLLHRAFSTKTLTLSLCLLALPGALHAAVTATAAVRGFHQDLRQTYVSVSITNPMSVPANCRLDFEGYGSYSVQHKAGLQVPTIPPGETRTLNIAVPLHVNSGYITEDGIRSSVSISSFGYGSNDYKGYLHAAEPSNQVTDPQLDDFTYRVHPDTGSSGYHSSSGTTTRSLSQAERIITQADIDTLPENWLCYVPLKNLIVSETAERSLTVGQREAIDTWLALGGTMTIYGAGLEETTATEGGGTVIRVTKNPILDPDFTPASGLSPFQIGRDLAGASIPYQETRAGGRNGAFLLATLFLIVVGPINYMYFARRQQIRMLIITVPLISLAFCSLIAVYFVITQGFSRKGGSVSITTVDEDTNRAVTFARHSLLSGLYPLGGFRFNPQTYFAADVAGNSRSAAEFDLTRETVLRNGLFQPGIPFNYSTILPYTTRERMLYDPASGELRNGFELPVKAVAVLSGEQFYRGGGAAPGGVSELTAVDAAELASLDTGTDRGADMKRLVQLIGKDLTSEELYSTSNMAYALAKEVGETSGSIYAALLAGVPKTSDSGIEITDGKNLHILIGRVATGGEGNE